MSARDDRPLVLVIAALAAAVLFSCGTARAETVRFDLTDGSTVRSDMSCATCTVGEFPADLVVWFDPSDDSTITHVANAVSDVANKAGDQVFSQTTAGSKPTRVAAGAAPLNGQQHLDYDGGDILSYVPGGAGGIGTGESGEVWWVVDVDSTASVFTAYSQIPGGSVNYVLSYAIQGGNAPGMAIHNATINALRRNTSISVGTTYIQRHTCSGTAYALYTNGSTDTLTIVTGANDGRWWADMGAMNSSNVGGHLASGVPTQRLDGQYGELFVDNAPLAAWHTTARYAYLSHKFAVTLP